MKSNITILSLSLLLAGCTALETVDKGLYQTADTLAKPDIITGERTPNIAPRDTQIKQGNNNSEQIIKKYGNNINENVDKAAYERLQNVFDRVHSVTHYRNENWNVVLIPESGFNAFTTGGTIIVVNKGLLDEIRSDDELAVIIGHEMGHITANHVFEASTYMMGAKVSGNKSIKSQGFRDSFTVGQETEADKIGILYAALAGYDPLAASQLWNRIYKKEGNNSAILGNHPINSERNVAANNIAKKVQQYYTPNQINQNFGAILENNTLWQKSSKYEKVDAGKGGGLLAVADAAANTMLKIQEAKLEQAKQIQRINLVNSVTQLLRPQGWDVFSDNSYGFYFQYIGDKPIKNLVLKTIYGIETLIFQQEEIVYPNQKITAIFNTNEPLQRFKVMQVFAVDSVELAD